MKDFPSPRERFLLALDHRETDRVPVDFLATPETWSRLRTYLDLEANDEILRILGIDLRHPRTAYVGPTHGLHPDGSWSDEWGVRRVRVAHQDGAYDEIAEHPLAGLRSERDLEDYPWPQPEWWDADALRVQIEVLDRETEYAIALEEFGDPGGIFEIAWYLRGMEALLIDLIERPELAFALMGKVTDVLLGRLERVLSVLGKRVDLIWTSDDIAHQQGPLMSVPLWKQLVAPHHRRLNQRVHEMGSRVMYHSCGAVRPFIPDLIDLGIDALDVLQFSAAGMDPLEIKTSFGDRLSFHGGIDVQGLLPREPAGRVQQVARELITVLGRSGGFILSPSHNVQVDTPPENILAVYRAAGSLPPDLPGTQK